MSWIESAVHEFGQSIGIGSLQLGDEGLVAFELEDGAELSIRCAPDDATADVIVAMQSGFAHPGAAARAALRLCDFRSARSLHLQVWGAGGKLTFAMRVPRRSFLLNSLEEAVDELFALGEAVRSGGVSP